MKKITAFILALSFALSSTAALAFYSSTFTDVEGDEYYAEAAEILAEVGVLSGYDDGTFGAEKSVRRSEMAAIVCRMLDLETEAKNAEGETQFDDVMADHWASGYINIACLLGIINGDGNGSFRPSDVVKYEEAVKMIVCTLGYQDFPTDGYNTWWEPYVDFADATGMTKNVQNDIIGTPSTRGDIAVMCYQGLLNEADMSENDNDTSNEDFEAFAVQILNIVNEYRTDAGISPLVLDTDLCELAQLHCEDMLERNFFSHDNPDGESPFDRMEKNGIYYGYAAENIASGQPTPETAMESWMNSPGHRSNIMNPNLKKLGVGMATNGNYEIYWTQCFTD